MDLFLASELPHHIPRPALIKIHLHMYSGLTDAFPIIGNTICISARNIHWDMSNVLDENIPWDINRVHSRLHQGVHSTPCMDSNSSNYSRLRDSLGDFGSQRARLEVIDGTLSELSDSFIALGLK